mgnify:CR=1 FL=1
MNIDNERAAFEAWVMEVCPDDREYLQTWDGSDYQVSRLSYQWDAWLARAQSDKAVSVEEADLVWFIDDAVATVGRREGMKVSWIGFGREDRLEVARHIIRALIAKETGNG